MNPEHLNVKIFAADPSPLVSRDFVPVFHRWIREHRLDELCIDVVDYGHVHHGPGVMLICHGAHYALDQGGGRIGMLYSGRRRERGALEEMLVVALRKALVASVALEEDPALAGRI